MCVSLPPPLRIELLQANWDGRWSRKGLALNRCGFPLSLTDGNENTVVWA